MTITTTIPKEICTYTYYLHNNCSFENLNNTGIFNKLVDEMLRTYPPNGINVEIAALSGYAFQLSNSLSQLASGVSDFSNIDLGECEALIRETYHIPNDVSLIFFKYENIANKSVDRDTQYNVYNPLNYEILNLSICQNLKVKLNVPIELSDDVIELIKNILDQGYNPFDLNDKFYREICTPYNSENGTDVLLDDREEYIYSTIVNETTCPSGCTPSAYSLDSKYITCECDANDGIVALDLNHISSENVASSFLSSLKNSNYKVMRCYNLVFNFKIFVHNYGSIITLIFFVIYVLFMIYYCCKDINPIKVEVSKLLFEEQKKEDKNKINPYLFQVRSTRTEKIQKSTKTSKKRKKGNIKNTKESYPPKKSHIRKGLKNDFDEGKNNNNLRLVDLIKKRNSKQSNVDEGDMNSERPRKRRSILDYQAEQENILKTRENLLNDINLQTKGNDNIHSKRKLKEKEKSVKINENIKKYDYDDYELNNMDYDSACQFDKRTCLRTYWSVIKREHYVVFTFISKYDHNLFYIKIERFFILICTEMTMNGMFFVHETMYKKKTGGTSFAQRLPQIIFSILVTHVMEIILCYLSMTDKHYYEIKALPKIHKNDERVFDILKCIRNKLTGFFIFTFLVFLFHWYFISAFCAVYQNTQLIFLRDSGISILVSLVDPFFIYGITCLLRAISLSICCKKKLCCIYKLSDIIPIF